MQFVSASALAWMKNAFAISVIWRTMVATFDEQKRPQIYFYVFSVLFVWQNKAEFHCFENNSTSEILRLSTRAQTVPACVRATPDPAEVWKSSLGILVIGMLCCHRCHFEKWFCEPCLGSSVS